jgi:SpoVK/Ycf46/Vps4 family AAA+-type ATPase
MVFKKKPEAVGGNYKIKSTKVFSSKENLFLNAKKYRKVYDEKESGYIYCELTFYNKLFDEHDWEAEVTLICTNTANDEVLCTLKKEVNVTKDKNVIYVREGWGTPEPSWWKKGKYEWKVYIGEEEVGQTFFYIVNAGLVTEEENPYFSIENIRLFESPREGLAPHERTYYSKYKSDETRFINIEIELKNSLVEEEFFPLELQFNFYNDAGQHKAYVEYVREVTDKREDVILDTGYGAQSLDYWYPDKYTIEVMFMDQLVAVVPFEVGDAFEEQEEGFTYTTFHGRNKGVVEAAGEEEEVKPTFEEASAELESLIGLKSVKEQLKELASYLQFLKIRAEKGLQESNSFSLHSVFTGNPGTGKTTVANMLGKIYYSLDLLSHGKVHEVGRADLVGEFIGQTAPKVKKAIDKARGGILFVDEAYSLTNRGDDAKDFGREVIEVLLKEMSDGSGDIAIIFAGYPKEMQNFLNSNPGMTSRLRNVVHFPDYTPRELVEITHFTAEKRGVVISEEAIEIIYKKLVEVYRNRNEHFGNARYVNGIVEEAKQNMALRLMKMDDISTFDTVALSTIDAIDLHKVFGTDDTQRVNLPIDDALLQDALTQLHELVGLDNIKQEVDEMAKLVRYYREIGKDISKSFSLHTVFKGNPGTGKTTIARLIVQIYKALGILERGHLVEVDRKDLVAGFVGQTAIKTGEMIDKAMGGGLFIDEAYGLTRGGNDFGNEAIETLLKRMEDHRGAFMVIVAGYPKEMQEFLETNPGLLSRFDKQFNFPDYNETQLFKIAEMMFEIEELELNDAAKVHLNKYIDNLAQTKHKYFGNARTVRKIVQQAVRNQNLRMASISKDVRTLYMIKTVILDDVKSFSLMEQQESDSPKIGFR